MCWFEQNAATGARHQQATELGGLGPRGNVWRLQLTVSLLLGSWEPLRPGVVKAMEPPWPGARPRREEETGDAGWRHRQTQAMQEVTSGVISEGWRDRRSSLWTCCLRSRREMLLCLLQAITLPPQLLAGFKHNVFTGIKSVFDDDNAFDRSFPNLIPCQVRLSQDFSELHFCLGLHLLAYGFLFFSNTDPNTNYEYFGWEAKSSIWQRELPRALWRHKESFAKISL